MEDDVSMKEKAFRICQDFLLGAWKNITLEEFGFTTVKGGLSNSMYCCSLPSTKGQRTSKDKKTPSQVLLRIYGPVQDAPDVIVREVATFVLLAERKLGPKLYGLVPGGRLEEFIPSRTLKKIDYRSYYVQIAKELAKIHALEVPIKKTPDFYEFYMIKWLTEMEMKKSLMIPEDSCVIDFHKQEHLWILEQLKLSESPVVYCHNDLQGGNILLKEKTDPSEEPKLILIDFEFGAYNYRGFDLANQFIEWCFDYSTGVFPHFTFDISLFPSHEEQSSYIRAYLEQLVTEGVLAEEDLSSELRRALSEIDLFVMTACLLWSLWSVKTGVNETLQEAGIAHREHGKVRREIYKIFKEKYLKLKQCNGKS